PRTLVGKGKLEEIMLRCLRIGAELVVFDCELKPGQWHAIVNSTDLKVIDRSMLILDIFAQRAKSSEGRLQVELAQLRYNLPRLVLKDTGLSRLTGGIGGRGPGETKMEIGRRRIRDRINELDKRIERLSSQRHLRRATRLKNAIPLVSILGYTNVGKSSLFNVLTQSAVLAENKLFATLDPAQRRLSLPLEMEDASIQVINLILSDTVGFIRELPAELRTAFRATLEELHEATLLVHVIDAADPDTPRRMSAVENVLAEMDLLDVPRIIVANKIDLISEERQRELHHEYGALLVSAHKKIGLEKLRLSILSHLGATTGLREVNLS
ncbi:MAG: GTPase HflX, partial [Bdellovibrionales bacterium]|nr:GTPase HflX [Bdellovibrionales bacterium]